MLMKKEYNHKNLIQTIGLGVLSLLLAALYLSLCFNRNIWTDEAFTVDLLNSYHSFGEIAAYTATDVHPPLYYWILKCFTDVFGVRLLLLKLLSVLPMFLLFLFGGLYVKKRFGFRTALLFILFTAAIPCSMEYAVQVRMYAWCMLFVTGAGFAAFDAYETGRIRSFLLLTLCGVCAAYSHYFAFAAILWIHGFLFLSLLVRFFRTKENRAGAGKALLFWLGTVLLSLLCYAPWMPYFAKQLKGVSASYWIPEITGDVMFDYLRWPFASDYPGVVILCQCLFAAAFLVLLVRLCVRHTKEDAAAFSALLVPVLVVLTGIVMSRLIRPVFIIRYVMPSIPLLCFFAAVVFSGFPKSAYAMLLIFLVFLTGLDYRCTYYDEYQATYTDRTLDFLVENCREDDLIVYNYRIYDFIYQCYFDSEQLRYIEDVDFGAESGRMWFLRTVYQPAPDASMLAENGWSMQYVGDFGIEQNEFWIYQLDRE